jgi:hypothetical protein
MAPLDAGLYEGVDLFSSAMGFGLVGYGCEFTFKLEGLSVKVA